MKKLAPSRLRGLRPCAPLALLALSVLGAPGLTGCNAIAQLNLIPVSQDPVLGAQAYPELLAEETTINSGAQYDTVLRMTDRLVAAAKEVTPDVAELFEWEVTLVRRDDLVNAWCLPGGKMAVYTGILPVAADANGDFETGLAVVMGHEIAHATLRHGTRAMTRQMGAQTILSIVALALGGGEDGGSAMALAAGSLGVNFLSLSFGRDAELEADRRGLLYIAMAGYDPREAVGFWQRMRASAGGAQQPEWMSTHPSNENRIKQIQDLLPEVLPVYEQSRGSGERKSFQR